MAHIGVAMRYSDSKVFHKNLRRLNLWLSKNPNLSVEIMVFYDRALDKQKLVRHFRQIRFWRSSQALNQKQVLRHLFKKSQAAYLVYIANHILVSPRDIVLLAATCQQNRVALSFLELRRIRLHQRDLASKATISKLLSQAFLLPFLLIKYHILKQRVLFHTLLHAPIQVDHIGLMGLHRASIKSLVESLCFHERRQMISDWLNLSYGREKMSYLVDWLAHHHFFVRCPGRAHSAHIITSKTSLMSRLYASYQGLAKLIQLSLEQKSLALTLNAHRLLHPVLHLAVLLALGFIFINLNYALMFLAVFLVFNLRSLFKRIFSKNPLKIIRDLVFRVLAILTV